MSAAAASAGADRIFVFGGSTGAGLTAVTRIYSASTDTWTSGASFPVPRKFAMAANLTDAVHLVGGTGAGGVLSDHRAYERGTNTWLLRAGLPKAVDAAVARVVGGKLYIIGGRSASGPTGAVQVFNPSTNTWVSRRSMPTARFSAASAVIDGRIYVAGGQTTGIGTTSKLERYDPVANTWTTLAPMPVTREALSGGNVNGRFCVAGGRLAASTPTGKAFGHTYCYDPSANAWAREANMITPRAEAAATEFGGALYTLGGRSPTALTTPTVERLVGAASLTVSTVTTGLSRDPDGYTLTLDGVGRPIGTAATVTLGALSTGTHSVGITGVAANCQVQGENPRSVIVTAGATAAASFTIECQPTFGTLRLVTTTTGPNPDPDGYAISMDGQAARPIGTNDVVTFEVPAGAHTFVLSGVARNCFRFDGLSQTTAVGAGAEGELPFAITCTAGRLLELVSARDHIPGSFLVERALYADHDRIYLGSYQGDLFVLARDRAAGFPIIQTIHLGSGITGVRGDADRLYVTAWDGRLRVFAKGPPLTLVATVVLANYRLSTLELFEGKIYVSLGSAELAVDSDRLYLAQLNEAEFAFELDKATLNVTRTYGETFFEGKTVVYDRLSGALQTTILNPVEQLGTARFAVLYSDGHSLFQTPAGCCGSGITIVKPPAFVESEFIPESNSNTVMAVQDGFVVGTEFGAVHYFDRKNGVHQKVNLRTITGHTGSEDIEIRSVWADGLDDLVFAGSSWGNATSSGPSLPSFFVLSLK